jgi:SAM-dependent methyltransferase
LIRARSPLSPEETEHVIRAFFLPCPSQVVRFLCDVHGADRKRVLDVGCGYGQHLVHFGPGSAGIDIQDKNVEFVRALGNQVEKVNIEDSLPAFDEPFDAVFCSNIMEHLVSPHLFLLRIRGLIKPGGSLIIHIPTIPPVPLLDTVIRRAIGHNGYQASEHLHAYTPRSAQFMLERAGYTVIDTAFVAARNKLLLRWAEPILREIGISVTLVAQPVEGFAYAEKRDPIFEPQSARTS